MINNRKSKKQEGDRNINKKNCVDAIMKKNNLTLKSSRLLCKQIDKYNKCIPKCFKNTNNNKRAQCLKSCQQKHYKNTAKYYKNTVNRISKSKRSKSKRSKSKRSKSKRSNS